MHLIVITKLRATALYIKMYYLHTVCYCENVWPCVKPNGKLNSFQIFYDCLEFLTLTFLLYVGMANESNTFCVKYVGNQNKILLKTYLNLLL